MLVFMMQTLKETKPNILTGLSKYQLGYRCKKVPEQQYPLWFNHENNMLISLQHAVLAQQPMTASKMTLKTL